MAEICSWKLKIGKEEFACSRERYKGSGFCILHSPQEDKSVEDFTEELKKALTSGDKRIVLEEIVFPKEKIRLPKLKLAKGSRVYFLDAKLAEGSGVYFDGATLAERSRVSFGGSTLAEGSWVSFRVAKLSKKADDWASLRSEFESLTADFQKLRPKIEIPEAMTTDKID